MVDSLTTPAGRGFSRCEHVLVEYPGSVLDEKTGFPIKLCLMNTGRWEQFPFGTHKRDVIYWERVT